MARQVVVIGAGMSGLVSAIAARQHGADVTVLEAGGAIGGAMASGGGLIWGPKDFETVRRWIPRGDRELQRVLVDERVDGWAWLQSLDLPLGPETTCFKDEMGRGRLMGLGEAGDRRPFAEAMGDRFRAMGGDVRVSTRVHAVTRQDGVWTITAGDGHETIHADRVVFASGGFHNNRDLVRRYITPWAETVISRGNATSDGLALRSMLEQGAQVSGGMHSFYGHTMPWIEGREWDADSDVLGASMYFTDYCILLNQLGLRFKDESVGCIDEHNAQVGSWQPHGRYYTVFDERVRRERVDSDLVGISGSAAPHTSNRVAELQRMGTNVICAASVEALAQALESAFDVPAATTIDSICSYNEGGELLYPERARDHVPMVEPPFWAVPSVAGITYTMGGLRVAPDMQVVDVPKAYAAGADAGRVFQDVYGGGLSWGLVSGRRAGATAARAERAP